VRVGSVPGRGDRARERSARPGPLSTSVDAGSPVVPTQRSTVLRGVDDPVRARGEARRVMRGPGPSARPGRRRVRGSGMGDRQVAPGWHRAFALLTRRVIPTPIVPTTDIRRHPDGAVGAHATARNARPTGPRPTDPRRALCHGQAAPDGPRRPTLTASRAPVTFASSCRVRSCPTRPPASPGAVSDGHPPRRYNDRPRGRLAQLVRALA
jgi:hypothetical protein